MIQPYHLIVLYYCAVIGLIVGILNLIYGPDPKGGFYRFARCVARPSGVGLIVFSILLFVRQFWAIDALILFFALAFIETTLTFNPASLIVTKRVKVSEIMFFYAFLLLVIYVAPVLFLIWLRHCFTSN